MIRKYDIIRTGLLEVTFANGSTQTTGNIDSILLYEIFKLMKEAAPVPSPDGVNSPALDRAPHNSGERLPSSNAAAGAGEAAPSDAVRSALADKIKSDWPCCAHQKRDAIIAALRSAPVSALVCCKGLAPASECRCEQERLRAPAVGVTREAIERIVRLALSSRLVQNIAGNAEGGQVKEREIASVIADVTAALSPAPDVFSGAKP